MSILSSCPSSTLRLRASWDTLQRPSYNPNAPQKPPKNPNPNSVAPLLKPLPAATLTARTDKSVFDLLKRPSEGLKETALSVDSGESYLGYEKWLPSAPKVEKPRTVFNAATLAYIGDGIYELYARRHFLFPPLSIEEFNDCVTSVVRCEAQDALLLELLNDDFLSKDERDVLRWGKNINTSKTRTKKRAGSAVYNRASSLETLVSADWFSLFDECKSLGKAHVKTGIFHGRIHADHIEGSKYQIVHKQGGGYSFIINEDGDEPVIISEALHPSSAKRPLTGLTMKHFVNDTINLSKF